MKKILLFLSRNLCYESNRYFMNCLGLALEEAGQKVEICDLSAEMEEKLENLLARQEEFLAAIDFNSLLPRIELEDGTPYLERFLVPFWNYLVDHPLYHHMGLKKAFPNYSILCIDTCHKAYVQKYYPHIARVNVVPLGAVQAGIERSFDQKRFELLFLGTYVSDENLCAEIKKYPVEQQKEIKYLIERMEADNELTQERAYEEYFMEQGIEVSIEEFASRLNQNYLADKYLRNKNRKSQILAAANSGVPFTIIGHGWDKLEKLRQKHIVWKSGVGYGVSVQLMAGAKMLLNTTPEFHGGLHDRVFTAMLNHTLCITEGTSYAQKHLQENKEIIFYKNTKIEDLSELLSKLQENPERIQRITDTAYRRASQEFGWKQRAEEILKIIM